ncbi:MAG: NAD(P)H-binding protein [Anaerolineales bacterium]|nr:NAD(P)H-binding protein [Anaerolineales bacterium]
MHGASDASGADGVGARREGYQVRILTRDPQKAQAKFGKEYALIGGDVDDLSSLQPAVQGCDAVHINPEGGLDPDLEHRGAANVAGAAAANVQRITYLSGTSVTKENCWYAGTKAKYEAEAAIRAADVPYTIFQGTFFMETLPRLVRGKRANLIGNQPHPWHWVAAGDYAGMVAKAYVTPAAANKTLHVFGPQAMTLRDALQTYCRLVNPGAKVASVPFWMASLLGTISRDKDLQAVVPFFRYIEQVAEAGDPGEANRLFGAPATTLEQWCNALVNSGADVT